MMPLIHQAKNFDLLVLTSKLFPKSNLIKDKIPVIDIDIVERQVSKWTISGELPLGLESNQESEIWSMKLLFWDSFYGRPCTFYI